MHRISQLAAEETDALRTLNPLAAILYLFVLAFAVTAFLPG